MCKNTKLAEGYASQAFGFGRIARLPGAFAKAFRRGTGATTRAGLVRIAKPLYFFDFPFSLGVPFCPGML
jgi:hypothetical protein